MNKLNTKRGTTSVSNKFIDDIMPSIDPRSVVVFLACERYQSDDAVFLAEKLGFKDTAVSEALNELKNHGLGSVRKTVTLAVQPMYTVDELDLFRSENEEIQRLFKMVEFKLGAPLKYTELNMYLSFYDWLKLPVDVIGFMLDYCIENGNSLGRYIEKVALDWSENGVFSVDLAKLHLHKFDIYRKIMSEFAISGSRNPKPKEIAQMDKWLKEYGFSLEIIAEAADRTLTNTGQASFAYAESILSKWFAQGVKTKADLSKVDAEFAQSKNKPEPKPAKPTKRKFHNYEGREWDQEKLDELKLLQETRLKRILDEIDGE